jgi:hypothetical protein
MKQYRPNVERAKWLYSQRQSRAACGLKLIPEVTEYWIPSRVRSMADVIWISDLIQNDMIRRGGIITFGASMRQKADCRSLDSGYPAH